MKPQVVKKRVLIVVENAPVPFDPRVWKEALSLQENGYGVTVLCPQHRGSDRRYEMLDGIHIYRHPMPKERSGLIGYFSEYLCAFFWEFLYTSWIFLRRGIDIIQGCNPPDDIFLVALPFKLLGVKYIFDHHDANPELYVAKFGKKGTVYNVLRYLEMLTFRFSDVVISTNDSYRALAISRGGLNRENVFVVRNGPDLDTFKAVPPNAALKHGKDSLVGYVGNMGEQDGLDILLDVAAHIKGLGRRNVHFTCVGGGPSLAELRKMVREKDVDDIVNFTGRIPDDQLLEILSTADICVNPDKPCEMNEISTMIKIMEYMALGKPIVQFDLKEGRFSAQEASLYADKEGGFVDFAAKVLWLLDNPEERKRMGDFGRSRVEQKLAWEYSVDNLLAAYQRALSAKKRRETGIGSSTDLASPRTSSNSVSLLRDRFRCGDSVGELSVNADLSRESGYFQFGPETTCFGRCSSPPPAASAAADLHDALGDVVLNDGSVHLPFDPANVVDNLLCEQYLAGGLSSSRGLRRLYYALRPVLSVPVRKHLQKRYLRNWSEIPFPKWPVDTTVENILEKLLALAMKAKGTTRLPFIWFWPDGAPSCTMVTHDIETSTGLNFCPQLMDLDDSFGIKSAFQIVPERRYTVSQSVVESIRARGFEVNIHDLNHDGQLMSDRNEFLRRAERINAYAHRFGARGFRSGAMYRNMDWYHALDFSYDMSVPNVAHLEPQRGGCCTVFPFFIGQILELPLTTIQDYSLFNILNDYSTRIWKEQISLIRRKFGLISFIAHPDYVIEETARRVYTDLLHYLRELRSQGETWIALPGEIADWWRLRTELSLVNVGDSWHIQGRGSERARLAYAVRDGDEISYELASTVVECRS